MAKMKIKPTHKMVSFLKKVLDGCKVNLVELNPEQFKWCVDYNEFDHESDFDWETRTFKVIRVTYPDEYYACPKYLTTKDLQFCLKQSNKTLDSFLNEVKAFCAI